MSYLIRRVLGTYQSIQGCSGQKPGLRAVQVSDQIHLRAASGIPPGIYRLEIDITNPPAAEPEVVTIQDEDAGRWSAGPRALARAVAFQVSRY